MVSSCKKYISSFYFWVFLFIKQSRVKSSNFAAVYVHTDFSEHNDLRGFMVKLEGILKHVKIKDRRVEVKIIHFYDEYEYSTSFFFQPCAPLGPMPHGIKEILVFKMHSKFFCKRRIHVWGDVDMAEN